MRGELVRQWVRRARRAAAIVLAAAAAVPAASSPGRAQDTGQDTAQVRGTLFERLNLDRLRFSAIGAAAGVIRPSKAEPTESYTLLADYGEIAPRWNVLFTATYWNSRVKQRYIDDLRDTLQKTITDPTNDFTIDLGRVRISDIALIADVHYTLLRAGPIRPYLGGGVGAHVVNAEGPAINGTLVEQGLDNITTGVAAMAGADVIFFRKFAIGGQARFDLLSAARFASVRASGTYIFDAPRRRAR